MDRPELSIRRAEADDVPAAIGIATAALAWQPGEPNEALFRWKHLENPAGPSPMWLALDGEEPVGFRAMLRWRFLAPDRTPRSAVRAVDTATRPDHQRRGAFRLLTSAAVDDLTIEDVDFVFNTPNENSRPGYLRMGWRDVGRLRTRIAVASPRALLRLARARTAAAKWSEPISLGEPVIELADDLGDLLGRLPAPDGIATDRTADHLVWRYGFEPLHYRAIRDDEGLAIVRVRRRGAAREAVLAEALSPDAATTRRLVARVRRELDVDHVLTLDRAPYPAPWLPAVPGSGPRLTVRDLATAGPGRDDFRFALGDIELF